MTPSARYRFHPGAVDDIEAIASYISRDNSEAAFEFTLHIFDTIRTLAAFPYIGHRNPKIADERIRFHGVHDYVIAYMADPKPIVVFAIVHGRRSPNFIAAMLREREKRDDR